MNFKSMSLYCRKAAISHLAQPRYTCYFISTLLTRYHWDLDIQFIMQMNSKAVNPSYICSAIAAIFSETWSHGEVMKKMERDSFLEYGSLMTETRLKFIEILSNLNTFELNFFLNPSWIFLRVTPQAAFSHPHFQFPFRLQPEHAHVIQWVKWIESFNKRDPD